MQIEEFASGFDVPVFNKLVTHSGDLACSIKVFALPFEK